MPHRDLPPLGLLPAFEAAGRLGSFKAAAAALHLTPSAISQQIKALEAAVGSPLFERRGRAVVLTSEGESFLRDVRQALEDLANAGRRLRRRAEGSVLRLSTVDFLAYEFVLPRLSAFRARFPGIELRLETSMELTDFDATDIDAAIRVGHGPWRGLESQPIGPAQSSVVCSPALAPRLTRLQDLVGLTLIQMRGQESRGWQTFLKAQGLASPNLSVLRLDGYLETLLAAEQGLGVAFGVFPMTSEWVLRGRLAVPFALRIPLPNQISFVHRRGDDRALLGELAAWLREQYTQLPALPEGRYPGSARARKPKR
jgi:LysR family glycine cleavage system transcriptional activator